MKRREEEHSLTALGQSERPGVHHAICPLVPELFDRIDDHAQSAPAGQLKHEWHVLEEDPWHGSLLEKTKDFVNQPRSRSAYPAGHAGLAQVLTRKTSRQE